MNSLEEKFLEIISGNEVVSDILRKAPELKIENWYLGAGCIAQTIWNHAHGFEPNHGIGDYDLVYFDNTDLSYEAEDKVIQAGKKIFGDLPVEIRNQARVHLWYEDHFGKKIEPYISTESAIDTWPSSVSVGVRLEPVGFKVYAPFSLDDLMNLVVRPNKLVITKDLYDKKTEKWKGLWPKLIIIPW